MLYYSMKSRSSSLKSFLFCSYAIPLPQLLSFQHLREPSVSAVPPSAQGAVRNLTGRSTPLLVLGIGLLFSVLGVAAGVACQESQPAAGLPPPAHLTSEQ